MWKAHFSPVNGTVTSGLEHGEEVCIFGIKDDSIDCFLVKIAVSEWALLVMCNTGGR